MVEAKAIDRRQLLQPGLDLTEAVHHLEQTTAIAFIKLGEAELPRPRGKCGVVATTLGFIGVRFAHRRRAANQMRRTNYLPVFPGRIIPKTKPSLLSVDDGNFRFGRFGWTVQPIRIGGTEDCAALIWRGRPDIYEHYLSPLSPSDLRTDK